MLLIWLLLCGGVGVEPDATPVPPVGMVVVVGGVGGLERLEVSLELAAKWRACPCEIQVFDWCHGKGRILRDLQDSRHHAHKIAELADRLRALKAAQPDRPLFLLARSGGTGLALAAAELLPPQTLERIILLAPAVAPTFDLRPALRATRREIVSFNSDLDWFVLGWGTWQFGTVDRQYTPSAGLGGFVVPAEAETREQYQRLVQVRWTPALLRTGHTGGHAGTILPTFLASEVLPWLKP